MEQPPSLPSEPMPPIPWASIGATVRRFVFPTIRTGALIVFTLLFLCGFIGWCDTFVTYSRADYYNVRFDHNEFEMQMNIARHAGYFLQWLGALAGMVLVDIAISLAGIKRTRAAAPPKTSN